MRLVHYFYSTRKTQANRCQPKLVGSNRKRVLRDQAVGRRRQDKGARLGARAMLMGGLASSLLWGSPRGQWRGRAPVAG
ncbi:hypothetical protein C4K21_1364 [Pseudomonas chlororaphis subsp. aurantiaca]|nr:hypothetical protein C4K21_1364 [Pseudomonas chlororaphis subsp. aurantiaca]